MCTGTAELIKTVCNIANGEDDGSHDLFHVIFIFSALNPQSCTLETSLLFFILVNDSGIQKDIEFLPRFLLSSMWRPILAHAKETTAVYTQFWKVYTFYVIVPMGGCGLQTMGLSLSAKVLLGCSPCRCCVATAGRGIT